MLGDKEIKKAKLGKLIISEIISEYRKSGLNEKKSILEDYLSKNI